MNKKLGIQKQKQIITWDLNANFNDADMKILEIYKFDPPSKIFELYLKGNFPLEKYEKYVGEIIKDLGQKRSIINKKSLRGKHGEKIAVLTPKIKTIQKYKKSKCFHEGTEIMKGEGVRKYKRRYKQPKRNAYKIQNR